MAGRTLEVPIGREPESARSALPHASRTAGQRFPDIGSYAVIGDCRTAALVGADGGIDWACFPDFSGDAVFATLLDRSVGGAFRLCVLDPVEVTTLYVPATAVLETTARTQRGLAIIREAMSTLNEEEDCLEPEVEILRQIEIVEGEVDVHLLFEPRTDYGATPVRLKSKGRLGWSFARRSRFFNLATDLDVRSSVDGMRIEGTTQLTAGARRDVSLSFVSQDPGVVPPLGPEAHARMTRTVDWWRNWTASIAWDGPYRDAIVRSALCLKLLTHARSGAVIAAPTTSLPEDVGGSRNWDYRYCWLRDASLTTRALVALGCMDEAGAFLDWLLHATRQTSPRLRVLYDVYGGDRIPERVLSHLHGWRGSRPVRIGNTAHDQLQLDGYGQIIAAAAEFVAGGGHLGATQRRYLSGLGRVVRRRWREPDAGIWEIRGERRHYTHSKMLCWTAIDCLIRLTEDGFLTENVEELARTRAEIARTIEEECYDPQRGYLAAIGWKDPDASLLTMPKYGYLDARDDRFRQTFETIDRELTVGDGLLLRYPSGFDGLRGLENAFGITSFWAVEALARMGRLEEAKRRMETLLDCASDFGLFGEEIDAATCGVLGNYPQAFTHVGLILAAEAIARADEREQR